MDINILTNRALSYLFHVQGYLAIGDMAGAKLSAAECRLIIAEARELQPADWEEQLDVEELARIENELVELGV